MTTEGSPGPGPEQQAAVQGTLARISALHKAPNLEVEELLGQFEQLDLLGVTGHPAIAAALRVEGQIPEVANRVRSDLETERFQRLGVLLGVEEPPVVVPEAEDGEMARLQGEVLAAARELAEKKGVSVDDVIRAHLPSEARVPTEDFSMLSLSQLQERAESLTSEQLSQIPPYKLSIMVENGLLTVRQVANLPKDQGDSEAIEYYAENMATFRDAIEAGNIISIGDLPKMTLAALRVLYKADAERLPDQMDNRIGLDLALQSLNYLERQWQEYERKTGKFLVGGLARIKTSAPVLSQDRIAQIRRMISIGDETKRTYEAETTAYGLSRMEDYLTNNGNLKLQPEEMESLENNLAKDPATFPLLAKYVRGLKEVEAARPPETAEQTARAQELFGRLRTAYKEKPTEMTVETERRTDQLQTQIGEVLGLGEDETTETIIKEEERGVLLGFRYKAETILEAILKSEQPSSPQTLFPQSKELQQAFVELQQAYQAFRDDSIVNKYEYDASIRAFFTTLDGAIGIDQDENSRLYGDADNAVFSFQSLLKGISEDIISGAQISHLSRAFAEKNRKMITNQRATNSWAQQELELLLGAAQRARLELNRVINLEPLLRAGVVLPT